MQPKTTLPLEKIVDNERRTITNYYEEVYCDEISGKRKVVKHALRDINEIWIKIHFVTEGKIHRVGKCPFVVLDSGEIKMLQSPAELFAYLFYKGALINWSDRVAGGITKSEMYQYVGTHAQLFEQITGLPHYPKLETVFYSKIFGAESTGALDQLIRMFNYATDADRQLLMAMFLTPFWGGPGGSRPAFLIDGLENDPLGNRGIGKTSITDALAHLAGDCIDISNKTDGEDIKKRILTAGDVRIIRMDNIKSSNLSNEVLESLITIKRVSGHRMYVGQAAIANWFTYILTFNEAALSRDMAQRCIVIRLKRPNYSASWYQDITEFIDKNRDKIIQDIGFMLGKEVARHPAHTRFPLWEREVLYRACDSIDCVFEAISKEQKATDTENQLAEDINEIMISEISKLWRIEAGTGNKKFFDPELDVVAIKRSVVFKWLCPLFEHNASRRYIAKRFERSRPNTFLADSKIYTGDHYLIWCGVLNEPKKITSAWRVDHDNDRIFVAAWNFSD